MHMRVSTEELRRDNQDSVPLPEGGGYLGWMGVFHELHCIVRRILREPDVNETGYFRAKFMPQRMLREWNYRSYYHAELSAKEQKHLGSHIGIYASLTHNSRGVSSANAVEYG